MRTQEEATHSPKKGDIWKQNKYASDDESDYFLITEDVDAEGCFRLMWKYVDDRWNLPSVTRSSAFWVSYNQYLGNVFEGEIVGFDAVVDAARRYFDVPAPAPAPAPAPVPAPEPPPAPAPEPKVRKIVDVVSDEARETRAKIEDEIGEVKEALRTGFDSLQNFYAPGVLADIQRTVRETSSEVSASRRALNDLALSQTERHDDLMAGISRAALQVNEHIGRASEAVIERQASLVEAVHQSEDRLKVWATDLASGVASDIVVQAQGSREAEVAMFDALRARFDLVVTACAGSIFVHVILLAFWGRS